MATFTESAALEEEQEDVSLCDFPLKMNKQDQTQHPKTTSTPKSESAQVIIGTQTQDQEFDFGSSMRGGANFLADTKMCAADEVFFQGQILPLRLSVSSDNGFNGLTRKSSSNFGFRSSSCSSRISHNSSMSSSSSSSTTNTTTTTATTTSIRGVASKPRSPRKPRNQFYTEPSPKPQIKISNSGLEKAGSGRHHKSSLWDFFRLGLVRTPDMELQDMNKVLRSNSKNNVSRTSSVNSNNGNNLIANYNNATTASESLKSAENVKQGKQRKQGFFGGAHGCKCSFQTVASDNVIIKSRSSSGRISASPINESKANTAAHGMLKEKVAMDQLKMKKNHKKQSKQKQKQAMSHQRTNEWLKELSHANSPLPLPVHV